MIKGPDDVKQHLPGKTPPAWNNKPCPQAEYIASPQQRYILFKSTLDEYPGSFSRLLKNVASKAEARQNETVDSGIC
jgi:hypothetical protein